MMPFPSPLIGTAVPILRDNVDTDAIIPSREMRTTGRTGLADGMFAPWRYTDADARTPDPSFPLNNPRAAGAQILLGGTNFGCGSSREHAVWALVEYGIKGIVAPSFAPIFKGNCIRNGLLPIELPRDVIEAMAWDHVTVDLGAQSLVHGASKHSFTIDPEAKLMLAEGLDAIDLTLKHRDEIARWLAADRAARPWIYLKETA